jgi:hypothetical protein
MNRIYQVEIRIYIIDIKKYLFHCINEQFEKDNKSNHPLIVYLARGLIISLANESELLVCFFFVVDFIGLMK